MYHYTRKILGVMLNSFLFTKYSLFRNILRHEGKSRFIICGPPDVPAQYFHSAGVENSEFECFYIHYAKKEFER